MDYLSTILLLLQSSKNEGAISFNGTIGVANIALLVVSVVSFHGRFKVIEARVTDLWNDFVQQKNTKGKTTE